MSAVRRTGNVTMDIQDRVISLANRMEVWLQKSTLEVFRKCVMVGIGWVRDIEKFLVMRALKESIIQGSGEDVLATNSWARIYFILVSYYLWYISVIIKENDSKNGWNKLSLHKKKTSSISLRQRMIRMINHFMI